MAGQQTNITSFFKNCDEKNFEIPREKIEDNIYTRALKRKLNDIRNVDRVETNVKHAENVIFV